jgi:hypothetical protein
VRCGRFLVIESARVSDEGSRSRSHQITTKKHGKPRGVSGGVHREATSRKTRKFTWDEILLLESIGIDCLRGHGDEIHNSRIATPRRPRSGFEAVVEGKGRHQVELVDMG